MRVLNNRLSKIIGLGLTVSMLAAGCGDANSSVVSTSVSETSVSESVETKEEVKEDTTEEKEVEKEETEKEETEEVDADIVKFNATQYTLPESEAVEFVLSLGAGMSLGNTFDANDSDKGKTGTDYETYWQNAKTTKQNIIDLHNAGINTLRIPVSWHNHVDSDFNIDADWMARIKEVVDWCMEEDMYVIINIHHDNEKAYMYPTYATLDNSKKYVTAIWSQIATTFGNYDEHVIYECLNEPRLKDTDNEWWIDTNSDIGKEAIDCINQLEQVIVDTIRTTPGEYNSSRYILCPGYDASPDYVVCDEFKLPDDSYASKENRLLISAHSYSPYNFALADDGSDSTDKFSVYNSESTSAITSFMIKLYNKYVANGIGVVIDEFGARDRDNIAARNTYTAFYTSTARGFGMTAFWWDNNNWSNSGEEFGLYKRETGEFIYPTIFKQMDYYENN